MIHKFLENLTLVQLLLLHEVDQNVFKVNLNVLIYIFDFLFTSNGIKLAALLH